MFLGKGQATTGIEFTQDDDFAPGVKRGREAAGMQAAAVEPGRHVHGPVRGVERKVHHHVVGGEHFIDVVDGHGLGPVGGAGSIEARGFVVDVRPVRTDRVAPRPARHVFPVRRIAGPGGSSLPYRHHAARLVTGKVQGLARRFHEFQVINKNFGRAVVDDQGQFARRQAVVDRAADGPGLVPGQIAEGEFRAVQQHIHDHAVSAHAVGRQGMGQTVGVGIESPVGPAPSAGRTVQGRTLREAAHIAQKTVQPGEFMLEGVPEHGDIVGKSHNMSPMTDSGIR